MAKAKVKRTSHALYDLWYHIAWSTKYRKKILKGKVKKRAQSLLQIIAAHHDAEIVDLEIKEDHLHMLISAPPRLSVAKMVQMLKSYSTHILFREFLKLRDEYWGGELWIAGYFVRSVGPGLTKEAIQKYIASQKEL